MHGAHALLAHAEPDALAAEPLHTFLEVHQYLCCMASVTSDEVPMILMSKPKRTIGIVHPLFGVAPTLYETLPLISSLASPSRTGLKSPEQIRLKVQEIELSLQSWAPNEETGSNRHDKEARAVAFALQWALILRLHQVSRKLRNDDPQVTKAANNILSAISLIRSGSKMEARILFPLFMAGVGSVTKPNRLTVEYRLTILETTIGFGNIVVAHRLLDELWRRSNDGDWVDWEELKDAKYPGLVLL